MGMINLGSSMRYGPNGKRRKTKAWTTKKRKVAPPHLQGELKQSQTELNRLQAIKEHRNKYPSYDSNKYIPTSYDDSYKKEVSQNYTVAIGYNKGGYQVIPKSEIKDIGK